MSLAPSEQHVLAEIESRLRRSDPALAARLALFRRRASRGRGPARERLSTWRTRPSRAIRLLLITITIIVAIVVTVLAARGGQPTHYPVAAICGVHAVQRQPQPACSPPGGSLPARRGAYAATPGGALPAR
jgi:hypothetical protein